MRRLLLYVLTGFWITSLLTACVDPYEAAFDATVDVLVVDGTLTDRVEPQQIRLNRSKADPLTGRFGTTPVTKATVEVVVDSLRTIACSETVDGTYQLPGDFRGQPGHRYQLRFTLSDGTRYVSTPQTMPRSVPIDRVSARFNPTSLPENEALAGRYRAGHDLFIDWQDPADQTNYYRWEWQLWERQQWCQSCRQGIYAPTNILPRTYRDRLFYVAGTDPYEACFVPVNYQDAAQPPFHAETYTYDYPCRTDCWAIFYSYALQVFSDQYSNGNRIQQRNVARIPYYDSTASLVEVRQLSLTPAAYTYFNQFQNQTQNVGGLADSPPSAAVGNVRNVGDTREKVVGYFTAAGVSTVRYWLDRLDSRGLPYGDTDPAGPSKQKGAALFYAQNQRQPTPEPAYPYPNVRVWGGPPRPPTALCTPSASRTPFRPEGWRD